jgi:hypothetical protein
MGKNFNSPLPTPSSKFPLDKGGSFIVNSFQPQALQVYALIDPFERRNRDHG